MKDHGASAIVNFCYVDRPIAQNAFHGIEFANIFSDDEKYEENNFYMSWKGSVCVVNCIISDHNHCESLKAILCKLYTSTLLKKKRLILQIPQALQCETCDKIFCTFSRVRNAYTIKNKVF